MPKRIGSVFDGSVIFRAWRSMEALYSECLRNSATYKTIKRGRGLIAGHKKLNLGIFIFTALLIYVLYRLTMYGR